MKPVFKVLIIIIGILILAVIVTSVTEVLKKQIESSKYMANIKAKELEYQYELDKQQIEYEGTLVGWLNTLLM